MTEEEQKKKRPKKKGNTKSRTLLELKVIKIFTKLKYQCERAKHTTYINRYTKKIQSKHNDFFKAWDIIATKDLITIYIQVTSGSYESLRYHMRKIEANWKQARSINLLYYYQKDKKNRWIPTIRTYQEKEWILIEDPEIWLETYLSNTPLQIKEAPF